jgi:DNA-binding response OmpR family regulator
LKRNLIRKSKLSNFKNLKTNPMKILIAEDDSVTLALIRHQLEKDNYTISAYTDARDALQSLETFKPDLIITDIVMPFTSGLELISIIRSSGIKTPILVLSAFDEEETVLEALSLGANDFITKPFNNAELSMRVKRLLNVKRK